MTTEPLTPDLDAIESRAAWAGSYSTDGVQAAAERFRIARVDVPALIARVRTAEAERDEAKRRDWGRAIDEIADRLDVIRWDGDGVPIDTLERFVQVWAPIDEALNERVRADDYDETTEILFRYDAARGRLALAPRTVETAEELDALWSDVTVLRASNGTVFGPCHGFEYEGWWQSIGESPGNAWKSAPLLEDFGPITVLNAPVPPNTEEAALP